MNDKFEMSQSELMDLVNRVKNQPANTTKLKAQMVIDGFYTNKRRHVRSLQRYKQIFREFTTMYPDLPQTKGELETFLSKIKGSDSNLATYYHVIRALYTYAKESFSYPDPFKKMHAPKISHTQYKLRTKEELDNILAAAKPGRELTLCLICLDSTCRIGALGRHETLPGKWYPGLHVDNLGYNSFTAPAEKTGERIYTCLPEYIEMMREIANPEGFIFHADRAATQISMTSKDLSKLFTTIVKRAGVTGTKLGPHSFRHLGGSLIARSTKSALAVKAKLGHDEIDTSMKYITEAEEFISQQISVSKLAGVNLDYIRHRQQTVRQNPLMIEATNPDGTTSTDLVPYNPTEVPIEKVEATIDITEQLFPQIPDNIKVHVYLTSKTLKAIRKASTYYHRQYANEDGTASELISAMKTWLRKTKS
jgi:integrase